MLFTGDNPAVVDMSFRQAITMSFRALRTRSMRVARDERSATVTTLNFETTSGLGVCFPSPCPRVLEHAKIKILTFRIVEYCRVLSSIVGNALSNVSGHRSRGRGTTRRTIARRLVHVRSVPGRTPCVSYPRRVVSPA